VPAARVQDADVGLNVPVLLVVKLTVPVGVVGVEDVSVTVAVQLLALLMVTEFGEHATEVVVVCGGAGMTASVKVPWLVAWDESPPYEPVIRWWPMTVGVYDMVQLAVPALVPAVRLQLPTVGEKVPVLLVAKVTVPVGVVGLVEVSVTVAVQLAAVPTVSELGEQATLVVVEWVVPWTVAVTAVEFVIALFVPPVPVMVTVKVVVEDAVLVRAQVLEAVPPAVNVTETGVHVPDTPLGEEATDSATEPANWRVAAPRLVRVTPTWAVAPLANDRLVVLEFMLNPLMRIVSVPSLAKGRPVAVNESR
jgi:hypothetical protein